MASNLPDKYTDAQREAARDLFLQNVGINDIAKQLSISTAALAKWRANDNWLEAREAANSIIQADKVSKRKIDLVNISDEAITQIKRSLKAVVDNPDPPTLQQAKTMAEIVGLVDKVYRLDNQLATDQISIQQKVSGSISVEKVREIILSDPFFTSQTTQKIEK